jgi:glycosyltransferase involved in cell wall biosynthesis
VRIGYVLDRWQELSQTFIVQEVEELRRCGVEVSIVALHESATTTDDALYLRRTPSGASRHLAAHLRWFARSPRRYVRFLLAVVAMASDRKQVAWKRLPWLAEELRTRGVDRLHAHFAWAGASAALIVSALTGWPWALTVHARDIYAPRPALPKKLSSCQLLVTVCQYNVELLRREQHLTRHIEIVVCGVLPPESVDRSDPELDVVAVGRLVEKKGFDLLLRAFRTVLDRRPGTTLEVIGGGPLEVELAQLREELGLGAGVRLTGPMPHADVLERIGQARLLCLPARVAADGDADSMPVVVKEAMARALPVVATAVTAIPEMVDEQVGLLVPPDDEPRLAAALLSLLDDPVGAARLGAAGRARVQERFTLSGEVGRLRLALERMAA